MRSSFEQRPPETLDERSANQLHVAHVPKPRGLIRTLVTRFLQLAGATVLAAVLFYAVLVISFALLKPTITFDPIAELDAAALAVPEEQRAWPIVASAAPLFRQVYATSTNAETPFHELLGTPPSEPDWPVLVAALAANRETIDLLQTLVWYEHLGLVLSTDLNWIDAGDPAAGSKSQQGSPALPPGQPIVFRSNELIDYHLLELQFYIGRVTRLLISDVEAAIQERDPQRAERSLLAAARLERLAPSWRREFALANTSYVTGACVWSAWPARGLFSDEALRRMSAELVQSRKKQVDLSSDFLRIRHLVQYSFSDNGSGDGLLTFDGWISIRKQLMWPTGSRHAGPLETLYELAMSPVTSAFGLTRREYQSVSEGAITELSERLRKPLWEYHPDGPPPNTIQRMAQDPAWRRRAPLVADSAEEHFRLVRLTHIIRMHQDVVLAAIALELFKRSTGAWPPSLAALVPDFLDTVPIDCFTGDPLGYTIKDGEPLLYCVGIDLDDDGGRAPSVDETRRTPIVRSERVSNWLPRAELERRLADPRLHTPDGDWVLLPVSRD